jgi:hypothetical protein
MDPEAKAVVKIISTVCVVIVVFIGGGMYGCPHYSVWQQNLAGQAELVRATQNRQIRIQEANARFESAKLDAQSEIERAKGTSEANKIVANGLGGGLSALSLHSTARQRRQERAHRHICADRGAVADH